MLEGTGYWACVRVKQGGPDWIVITTDRCGSTARDLPPLGLRDHPRFVGPVRRALRYSPGGIPPAPVVCVDVTAEPGIVGQDVWPVVPSNMWQSEQAAIICAALRGHAAALPRAPAEHSSNNRPAASLSMLHCGLRA